MSQVHAGLENRTFEKPADVTTSTVCKKSGKLVAAGLCDADPRGSMAITEYFAEGTVPTEHCDHHVNVTVCAESGLLATEFCPNKVGGVFITGGDPGSADGPYLITEGAVTNTCPLHTTPPEVHHENTNDDDDEDDDKKKKDDQKKNENSNKKNENQASSNKKNNRG